METHKERQLLKGVYSGPGWAKKVDNWPDDQVIAVFFRFVNQGKIKV